MNPFARYATVSLALAALAASTPARGGSSSIETLPGYVDLGEFVPPESGGTYVEVNLGAPLLALASRFVAVEEPAVAELIRGLRAVRVNVVGIDDANRDALKQRAESIQQSLTGRGWEKVVAVRESGEQVDVYVRSSADGETVEGITLAVLEAKGEAVFINIVGNVRFEQIALVGEHFGIDPLKQVGRKASGS
jgi:hypothetical protein